MGETTLHDVECALIDASNRLLEIHNLCTDPRYEPLDDAIDHAIRVVQAWRKEREGQI